MSELPAGPVIFIFDNEKCFVFDYALLAPRPSYEIKTPNDALNNIGQRETPFIKRKGEHLPFRPVFDYFTAWKLHRRKGLQINVGKISLVFVVVLCSAYTRHLCPCCVWTNEESLAAAFRNSRKNRQKNIKTRVNLVPPASNMVSERSDRPFRSFCICWFFHT